MAAVRQRAAKMAAVRQRAAKMAAVRHGRQDARDTARQAGCPRYNSENENEDQRRLLCGGLGAVEQIEKHFRPVDALAFEQRYASLNHGRTAA